MKKVKITEEQYKLILSENNIKKDNFKTLKITKEQYGKLLSSGIIFENSKNIKLIIEDENSSDKDVNNKFSIDNFLAFLYNKPGVIPSLLKNYEEFRDMLLAKKMITKNGDEYSVNKSLSKDPISAKKAIETEILNFTNNNTIDEEDNTIDSEVGQEYKTIYVGDEIAILKGPNGKLYAFYHTKIDEDNLLEIVDVFGNGDDINPSEITNYVNSNLDSLSTGKGLDGLLKDKDLIEIDSALAKDLIDVYKEDAGLENALTNSTNNEDKMSLPEMGLGGGGMGGTNTSSVGGSYTGALSSGSESNKEDDIIKKDRITSDIPIIGETTTVGSVSGEYDTPGFIGVSKTHNLGKAPKTKAQKKTQYSGGGFVDFDDCTKLNNNKKAQNGGCSVGAIDGVVKIKKSKGSIISPSLNENCIYEVISKKTGKSIEDIIKIIESKK